jgi:poly-gamma-glutamate synthesis protein (capsule biosynthesis protein)
MTDIKMVLVGDVFVGRPDPDSAFEPVKHLIQGTDIAFCNLETIVADRKHIDRYDRSRLPRMDESAMGAYLRAGFNVMNQANNPHTYHGLHALVRSVEVMEELNVVHAGAGRSLAEARKPGIIERHGTKVAFVCRTSVGTPEMAATVDTPGVARYPVFTTYEAPSRVHSNPGLLPIVHTAPDRGEHREQLAEDIRKARNAADMVIVSWHWGLSPFQVYPNAGPGEVEVMEYQEEMGRYAIDCGADMVVGHHPHEPQPIEVYKGKPILYSLANFVHDLDSFAHRKLMALLVRCVIRDGKIQRLSFVPGTLDGNGPPKFTRPADSPGVVDRMIQMSAPYGTRFDAGEDDVAVLL